MVLGFLFKNQAKNLKNTILYKDGNIEKYMEKKQMKTQTQYAYPGSFCPPTYGHLFILKRAAEFLSEIVVVCSENPDKKNRWFDAETCKMLWKTYPLPKNVKIIMFDEFIHENAHGPEIVMIRGIRNDEDFEQEKRVIALNSKKFGIEKYLYLVSDIEHKEISSTKARSLAQELKLEELAKCVSPMVISALLEKTLEIRNLFLVVGKPGGGKSTFLKMLSNESAKNIHINTDEFSDKLKPLIEKSFPKQDIFSLALTRENELLRVIAEPWMELLKKSLKAVPKQTNVFVEIPYGLEPNKSLFRFIGGKILHVGCRRIKTNTKRNEMRGTPKLKDFMEKIPSLEESKIIAKKHGLRLFHINTDCSLRELREKAKNFNAQTQKEIPL